MIPEIKNIIGYYRENLEAKRLRLRIRKRKDIEIHGIHEQYVCGEFFNLVFSTNYKGINRQSSHYITAYPHETEVKEYLRKLPEQQRHDTIKDIFHELVGKIVFQ